MEVVSNEPESEEEPFNPAKPYVPHYPGVKKYVYHYTPPVPKIFNPKTKLPIVEEPHSFEKAKVVVTVKPLLPGMVPEPVKVSKIIHHVHHYS